MPETTWCATLLVPTVLAGEEDSKRAHVRPPLPSTLRPSSARHGPLRGPRCPRCVRGRTARHIVSHVPLISSLRGSPLILRNGTSYNSVAAHGVKPASRPACMNRQVQARESSTRPAVPRITHQTQEVLQGRVVAIFVRTPRPASITVSCDTKGELLAPCRSWPVTDK